MSLLRRAFKPSAALPPPEGKGKTEDSDELSEDEYEVERIVAERRRDYRVRWVGFDASEDSWIAKSELAKTAPDVVASWLAREGNEDNND